MVIDRARSMAIKAVSHHQHQTGDADGFAFDVPFIRFKLFAGMDGIFHGVGLLEIGRKHCIQQGELAIGFKGFLVLAIGCRRRDGAHLVAEIVAFFLLAARNSSTRESRLLTCTDRMLSCAWVFVDSLLMAQCCKNVDIQEGQQYKQQEEYGHLFSNVEDKKEQNTEIHDK